MCIVECIIGFGNKNVRVSTSCARKRRIMHHEILCGRCLAQKAGVASGLWFCLWIVVLSRSWSSVLISHQRNGAAFLSRVKKKKATRRRNQARDASVSGTRVYSSSSSSSDLHVTLRLSSHAFSHSSWE